MDLNFQSLKPDSKSRFLLRNGQSKYEITFRYFSPQKCRTSQKSIPNATGSRTNSQQKSQNNQAVDLIYSDRLKVYHNPREHSSKFYFCSVQQIKDSPIVYFQQFQQKLYNSVIPNKRQGSIVKLRLTKQSKEKVKNNNKAQKNKTFVKRVQIELGNNKRKEHIQEYKNKQNKQVIWASQRQKQKNRVTRMNNFKDKKPDIIIKLYDKQKGKDKMEHYSESRQEHSENSVDYFTPRPKSSSKRKGIRVYSSVSTAKQSYIEIDGVTFSQGKYNRSTNSNIQNVSILQDSYRQNTTPLKPSEDKRTKASKLSGIGQLLSLKDKKKDYLTNEELKRRTQKTKRRVYSKSKLGKKSNPTVTKALFNDHKQSHRFS